MSTGLCRGMRHDDNPADAAGQAMTILWAFQPTCSSHRDMSNPDTAGDLLGNLTILQALALAKVSAARKIEPRSNPEKNRA
ncbi:MAG: hypothetical protein ABI832_11005 [bacterium]